MKTKFIWLIISCLMVAALVLASCAPAVVEEKKATVVTKEPEKKVEKVEEVVEKVGPQYGGIVNIGTYWEISNFDPADAIWQTKCVQAYTHDQIVRGDWYIENRDIYKHGWYMYWNEATWLGALAESWEVVDPLTFVYKVREGVRWQNKPPLNGREFVADDIVQHFTRMLAAPRFSGSPLQTIEEVTATDKYTVRFDLKEPVFTLLKEIGMQKITAHELWEQYGDLRHWTTSIGTGPFMLEDFLLGSSLTFKRNPDYWEIDPTNGNQLPYIDGVRCMMIPDSSTRFAALRTGKLDHDAYIPWTQKDALAAAAPELQWQVTPDGSVFSLWLKNSIEPFNNVKVRQALWMAVNREELTTTLFPPGVATLEYAAQESWPGIWIPFDELTETAQMVLTYDPVAAKALLADAGYPSGFQTVVQYHAVGAWAFANDGLALIKEYWDAIGVDLELRPVDAGTMSSLRYAPYPYEAIMGVAGGWLTDAHQLIEMKFVSGAPWNRGVISDPYIDEMFDKIKVEWDIEKRTTMYKEVFLHILEEAKNINLPLGATYLAWWPWLKGYDGEAAINDYHRGGVLAHIWLDQDLREQMTGRK